MYITDVEQQTKKIKLIQKKLLIKLRLIQGLVMIKKLVEKVSKNSEKNGCLVILLKKLIEN